MFRRLFEVVREWYNKITLISAPEPAPDVPVDPLPPVIDPVPVEPVPVEPAPAPDDPAPVPVDPEPAPPVTDDPTGGWEPVDAEAPVDDTPSFINTDPVAPSPYGPGDEDVVQDDGGTA